MTEQEAIKILKSKLHLDCKVAEAMGELEARDIGIKALEEVQQYRALGTVEELKEAKEKQMAKNWIAEYIGDGEFIWTCPSCKETFALMDGTPQDNEYNYCPSCGQALAERKICCSNCRELYEEYGMKLCKIYEEPQENIDTECCEHHTLDWGNEDENSL